MKEFQTKETCSVYGDLQYVSRANPRKIIRHWKSKPYHRDLFLKGWMPPHPAFFVKKKCYEQYGTFNTSFTISADYELMLRFLFKHGISSSYMPEVLVRMRMGGISNLSLKNRLRANREDRNAWKVNGVHPGSLTLILKPLSKLRQFLR
jgi:glycosyltransferase